MIVLDTEVVLELMSPTPPPEFLDWVGRTHGVPLHLTAVTFADLNAMLDARSRDPQQEAAKRAAARVLSSFRDAILPFDAIAGLQYSAALADATRVKAALTLADVQTTAICRAHDAALATRRTTAFRAAAVPLVNPWDASPTAPDASRRAGTDHRRRA